jgi:ABC-type sugar transport system permease subunit
MAETKDWIFLIPIIVVVLMIVLLFLPIMYLSMDYYLTPHPPPPDFSVAGDLLPFGGSFLEELEPYVSLYSDAESMRNGFMWVGIIFAIGYGLDALTLLIGAIRVKTGSKELKKARKRWLGSGIAKIISQVVVIFIMVAIIPGILEEYGIIFGFTIGLGMILTMVAGGILILGYIIAKIAD